MDAVLEVHGAYRAFVGNRKRGKVVEGTPSCQQCDQCQDAGSDEHGLAFNPHSPPPLGALCWAFLFFFFFFLFVVNFVIHWNKTAMGLHVFPIPIPPPTSLSTRYP